MVLGFGRAVRENKERTKREHTYIHMHICAVRLPCGVIDSTRVKGKRWKKMEQKKAGEEARTRKETRKGETQKMEEGARKA